MPNDPRFVRLADHLADSTLSDIAGGSGFTISGRDVQPFPGDEAGQRFVRSRLVQGHLEPAGKAEYEEIQSANEVIAEIALESLPADQPLQEGTVQRAAAEAARRIAKSRSAAQEEEDEEDSDTEENDRFDEMGGDELTTELRNRRLPTSGSNDEKRARLRAAEAG